MNSEKKYPIIIRKKTPFLTDFLSGMVMICFLVLAVCMFFFGPPLSSNNEMKVVTGILVIPPAISKLIFYSAVGCPILFFSYKHLFINQKAFLSFNQKGIVIFTNKNVIQIPAIEIARIEFVDPSDINEMPRGKFFLIIYKRNLETINIRLKDYNDSDEIIDNIIKYNNLKDHLKDIETLNDPGIDSEI
jgi:hypothetical protein